MTEQGLYPVPTPDSGTEVNGGYGEIVSTYLQWHDVEGHTPATIETYRKRLDQFARWLQPRPRNRLQDLTHADMLAYLSHIKAGGKASPHSVRSRYLSMHAFFQWCVDWDYLPANPMERLHTPKVPKVRKPFLQEEGFRAMLALCPQSTFLGARRAAMLWLFSTTSMRLAELTGVRREDLDWKGGAIRVMGKGQKERRVPFTRDAQRAVLRYLANRRDALPALWVTPPELGKVRPMKAAAVSNDMRKLPERAGIAVKDRCHIFRRTWAAAASRQKIPRQYIRATGGWESDRMIELYTRAMEQEAEALGSFEGFSPWGG